MSNDSAIPLGIYLIKRKSTNLERYMHADIHSNIIYNCQDMDAIQVSINRWLDKEDVVCVYVCVYIYMYIYVFIYIYTYIYVCIYVCTHVHTYTCIYMYVYIYVHIYVCIYIYTHTHTYTVEWVLLSHLKRMKFCHMQQHGWTWRVLW